MKNLPRIEAITLWDQWFTETKEEWFKVEVLQDYTPEDDGPSLEAWLAGDRKKALELMAKEASQASWTKQFQESPARKRRFHIVEEPYTAYLQWEIEWYKHVNIPLASEEVFLVPKKNIRHLDIPAGDFKIFDGKRVVVNHYTAQGLVESMDFYEAGDDISHFLALREELPKHAIAVQV